jgi:hypothetical protein
MGQPKIIDFGVARATNLDHRTATLNTHSGMLIGTLAYMSPEQVAGDRGPVSFDSEGRENVDGRSDVYSLGVIGFELLGGRLPYDLAGRSVPEAARIIRDEDPSSLSSISRIHRGDVDTIIRRAMAKEPAWRYQTAAEMAADIRRFLSDETDPGAPAIAALSTRQVRSATQGACGRTCAGVPRADRRRWWRRPRDGCERSNPKRRRVETQRWPRRRARCCRASLPTRSPAWRVEAATCAVVDMLNASSKDLSEQLAGFPEIEVVARRTLGETYSNLGFYKEAETICGRPWIWPRRSNRD